METANKPVEVRRAFFPPRGISVEICPSIPSSLGRVEGGIHSTFQPNEMLPVHNSSHGVERPSTIKNFTIRR